MAKKKTVKRRSSKKKGMSPLLKILIGGAVLGGGYLIYDQFFSNKPTPEEAAAKAAADAAAAAGTSDESVQAAKAINAIDPGTNVSKPAIQALLPKWLDPTKTDGRKLSAKGTVGSKQNWGLKLYKNDIGGEVETLQSLFNRISKLYGKAGIGIDGNFGNDTEGKRIAIVGGAPGVTLAQVYKLFKAVEASKKPLPPMGKPMTMDPYNQSLYLPTSGLPTISPLWTPKL